MGLIFAVYTLMRLLFWVMNRSLFADFDISTILAAFWNGIPFDLSAILYTNLLIILLSILPFKFVENRIYQRIIKICFLVINGIALLASVIDLEYVKFTGRRSDLFSINILDDILRQSAQLVSNYWGISLFFMGLMVLLAYLTPTVKNPKYPLKLLPGIGVFLLFGGLVFLGLRGGVGKYPLMPVHAFKKGEPQEMGLLTNNTPFNIIMSVGKQTLKAYHFMPENELEPLLSDAYTRADSAQSQPQNVVILILESFSAEFTGHLHKKAIYTPHLDSIAREGSFFEYAFANGRTSAEAISTILTGVPSMFKGALSSSIYQSNQFYNLFGELKQRGYQTGFYHGGFNGTMLFDQWTHKLGIPYFGMNEYPMPDRDFDGTWGIFDEPYLQYFARQMDELAEPFATAVFTLSSHQPFTVPDAHKDKFVQEELPIYAAIQYADYALGQFFKTASQMDWFDRTLFIITADHAFPAAKGPQGLLDLYRIPMVLYHPGQQLDIDSTQIVEQLDVVISVADFLGIEAGPFPRLGRSFFSQTSMDEQDAIFFREPFTYMIRPDYMILFDGNKQFTPFSWQQENLTDSISAPNDVMRFKAYLQYYSHQLIHNTFVPRQ